MSVRIGQGVDVHAFAASDGRRPLRLAGVDIPGAPALEGHSDADVVLHAVADALLGAAALGDLGALFGSDDPHYAGADSAMFVREAVRRVGEAGWALGNLDCTVVAERPRLAEHLPMMRSQLAELLGVEPDAVSIKATSTDGLGFTGRGEGIACLAVVLLTARL
jgi:2-C-methyl-D-erythritol 2,4-cyclodiphosphate synthase